MAGVEDAAIDDRNCRRDCGKSPDSAGDDGVDDSPSSPGVSCSICLEPVAEDGSRSRAKLQCGHEFHLDCIGSAFNTKGAMQCPNCRKVEKGQWLYANGSPRPFPEFMDDWIPDEDLYGLSYPETHYRFQWCPFGELSHAAASFEELDSPTTTYHEFNGHHTIYAEHTATSSIAHSHSYLAYVGPVPAATTTRTGDSAEDHHPWNSHSGQNDNFNRLAVATPYLGWEHLHHLSHSFPLPTGHAVAAADPVAAEIDASARHRSYRHPFLFGYRSAAPTIHRHPGSRTVARERIHASHIFDHHRQQQTGNGLNLAWHLNHLTRRGVLPEQSSGFFVFPHPSSLNETETDHFQTWENDWFPRFPVSSRDSASGWGSHSNLWRRHFS
ncbi:PREDICTED: uncharacterized protein LOC104817500 [Tarenaya hassleriana]|uniref:uncharacterized protein LOC104817500 n=1 Tax=Tarenaya hassleriana TaxID=28532 RepID=UPI00053C91F7|nr:PREDICTED: uncharacterized protein LOC104817500 [Tarenaya hassleriana]